MHGAHRGVRRRARPFVGADALELMTNKAGTMNLQWGDTGKEVLERRQAASTARLQRQYEMLRRQRREGQGISRPTETVPELDRYLYDLQGVSDAPQLPIVVYLPPCTDLHTNPANSGCTTQRPRSRTRFVVSVLSHQGCSRTCGTRCDERRC